MGPNWFNCTLNDYFMTISTSLFLFPVNVASRMDSTGENWKIQVPDYTAQLLQRKGYTCSVSSDIQSRPGTHAQLNYYCSILWHYTCFTFRTDPRGNHGERQRHHADVLGAGQGRLPADVRPDTGRSAARPIAIPATTILAPQFVGRSRSGHDAGLQTQQHRTFDP